MCQIPDIGVLNLRPHCKPQPIVVCLQSNSKSAPECTVLAPKMADMVRAQLIFTRPRRKPILQVAVLTAVLNISSVSVLMVRANLLDLYAKGVFVDSKTIKNFAS